MTYAFVTPKKWAEFQHYKDRSPPWLKLHKSLLDDFDFHSLPIASKALAPMLWLLASEYADGKLPLEYDRIAFRLRMSGVEVKQAIKPLIDRGFLVLEQVASDLLADCLPRERGEGEKETEGEPPAGGTPPAEPSRKAKVEKTKKPPKTRLPDGFGISPRVRQWAAEKKFHSLEKHLEHFIGCAKARGYEYIDWDEAFMNAIRANWAKVPEAVNTLHPVVGNQLTEVPADWRNSNAGIDAMARQLGIEQGYEQWHAFKARVIKAGAEWEADNT